LGATVSAAYRWDRPGVPQKGWTLVAVDDLGEAEHTCQMCGNEQVRFVHTVEHPKSDSLEVGCVCAGHMTNNYVTSKKVERELKSRAARRLKWADRNWKISRKGNAYLRFSGRVATIFQRWNGWKFVVSYVASELFDPSNPVWSEQAYPTQEAAQLGVFDLLNPLPFPARKKKL